jgi:adenylate cyclase
MCPNLNARLAARGFGLVNTTRDVDAVVRRMPLVMRYDGEAMPSLAVELLRLAIGANWLTIKTDAPEFVSLKGQVALIGVTALGLTDIVSTPVNPRMDGVEVHAQVIENIISNQRLIRTRFALGVELATAFFCGLIIIGLLPRLLTVSGFIVVLAALLAGFGASFWAFLSWR